MRAASRPGRSTNRHPVGWRSTGMSTSMPAARPTRSAPGPAGRESRAGRAARARRRRAAGRGRVRPAPRGRGHPGHDRTPPARTPAGPVRASPRPPVDERLDRGGDGRARAGSTERAAAARRPYAAGRRRTTRRSGSSGWVGPPVRALSTQRPSVIGRARVSVAARSMAVVGWTSPLRPGSSRSEKRSSAVGLASPLRHLGHALQHGRTVVRRGLEGRVRDDEAVEREDGEHDGRAAAPGAGAPRRRWSRGR